jgi:hypothetical protein
MELINLFEELKEKFLSCFFTHKGNKIKVHEESIHQGIPVYDFTQFKFPYKLGIHYELVDYLDKNGFYTSLNKNGELTIQKL